MRASAGRAVYDRKIGDRKTHHEAMRCLKRRLADRVWHTMVADERRAGADSPRSASVADGTSFGRCSGSSVADGDASPELTEPGRPCRALRACRALRGRARAGEPAEHRPPGVVHERRLLGGVDQLVHLDPAARTFVCGNGKLAAFIGARRPRPVRRWAAQSLRRRRSSPHHRRGRGRIAG